MLNRGLDKLELLRIVEAVANEKSIDKEVVIGSMESAIQKAALTKFGNDNNIEVSIDRENGDIKTQKVLSIVENVEDTSREITLADAIKFKKDENLKIPTDTNYKKIGSLSNEIIEKLSKIKPPTLGAASRVSGVTPPAIIAILRYLKKNKKRRAA